MQSLLTRTPHHRCRWPLASFLSALCYAMLCHAMPCCARYYIWYLLYGIWYTAYQSIVGGGVVWTGSLLATEYRWKGNCESNSLAAHHTMIERAILGFIILLILAIVWFSVNHNIADDDEGERRLFEISTSFQYRGTPTFLREDTGVGLSQLTNVKRA